VTFGRGWPGGRPLGTLSGLGALVLLLWVATPHFLTVSNLLNVLEQSCRSARSWR
jgi:ribose/xylose/arabinose/galactoside ABC-type transport system permease subunit